MRAISDLLSSTVDPSIHDGQRFLGWDSGELTGLLDFADVTMGGDVLGKAPHEEIAKVLRVTHPTGIVIACRGSNDTDDERHDTFVEAGSQRSRFEESGDGTKGNDWKER